MFYLACQVMNTASSKKRIVLRRAVNKLMPLNSPAASIIHSEFLGGYAKSNPGTSGQRSTDRQIKIASEASELHILQKGYRTDNLQKNHLHFYQYFLWILM